ncbi:hypothetical protein SAMN04515617_11529 [Collimonas sp. OK242]|nr:hypothetical protein SAMN04515617_11529 [Collimonas sp. OK242]
MLGSKFHAQETAAENRSEKREKPGNFARYKLQNCPLLSFVVTFSVSYKTERRPVRGASLCCHSGQTAAAQDSRSMVLMPRIAWRIRASFSINANRTYSSPYSPKPMPGETHTLAFSSSCLENSSDPRWRYGSGI